MNSPKYTVEIFKHNNWIRYSSHKNWDMAEANADAIFSAYDVRIIYKGNVIQLKEKRRDGKVTPNRYQL